ncbi:MAG: UDP-N-acetylmuramoyl-tripeptide--D-alanyl-D-alanine ligase [Bacteroidales bacterium]|jgi:UDP-N-acetylmuramoyl-tripeptide--D-alanyl-D-alanine ligase|nr:UDP-N-acetylmuramoyl-tripeptide--D-alanyl-D-alanine ligase [Bacteroidales bacterium]
MDMCIDKLYRLFIRHPNIITDSRTVAENGIFFALKGNSFDGNRFAAQALENGAACAVVDDAETVKDNRYILVTNVLTALQDLARMHRRKSDIPVIALTGTNGKTTTKELIKSILSTKYDTLATEGNLNNHIGVPLTLLRINRHTQIAVIEMGANHQGEIKTLCDIALPTHGLITNIGKGHLEGFGSEEGIKQTKKELYDYLSTHNGTIFYRETNPVLATLLADSPAIRIAYGSVCSGTALAAAPFLQMNLNIAGVDYTVQTQMAGAYNLENVLAATCTGSFFGISPKQIVTALSGYLPQNNRSQIVQTARNRLLVDYYNANPTSMSASLTDFFDRMTGDKMVILGDMFELGEAALAEHQAIVDLLAARREVVGIVTGKYFSLAAKNHPTVLAFEETGALKEWLSRKPPCGKTILIKASRAMKMEQIQELL